MVDEHTIKPTGLLPKPPWAGPPLSRLLGLKRAWRHGVPSVCDYCVNPNVLVDQITNGRETLLKE